MTTYWDVPIIGDDCIYTWKKLVYSFGAIVNMHDSDYIAI